MGYTKMISKITSDSKYAQRELQSRQPTIQKKLNILQALSDLLRIQGRLSAGGILVVMIGGIILAEVVAMMVVYHVRDWPYSQQVTLDATIMAVIIFPLIYFLSFKPLLLKIQQQARSESIIQVRLRLMEYAHAHSLDELLQFTLDEIEDLTGSAVSFLHFLEANQETLKLQVWSTNTMQSFKVEVEDGRFNVNQAGAWAEAIRYHKPIINNNQSELPHRQEISEGDLPFNREMGVPILRDNMVMAVLGLGNKSQDFTADDVKLVSTIADFAWDIVQHKQAESALSQSEERFRTIADWTYAWEMWLDPNGNIVYTSPSCEPTTGYTPEEFITDPSLLIDIIHPDDRQFYTEHERVLHDAAAGPISIEYRIITRDGSEHWLEHVCRPLWGSDGNYLGRRISNRDITHRKQNEQKIVEQIQKEAILTRTIQTIQTDIARDLHDTLGQNISFLRMSLEGLSYTKKNDQTGSHVPIQTMIKAANESYDLIRSMLDILQSGYSADPLSLFTRYASQVAERSLIQIDMKNHGPSHQLSPHQVRQLFFIFRETLSNIEKHANASKVSGEFFWGKHTLTLMVSDNGHGFDPDAIQTSDHYGLRFMRERANQVEGTLVVRACPGEGTTITVAVPYENEIATLPA